MIWFLVEKLGYITIDRQRILAQYFEHPGSRYGETILSEYLNTVLQTLIFAILLYLFMSTCSYVYVFIRNKNRFIPLYNGESLIAFDIKLSIINILGETFLVSILRIALPRYSLIYYDFKDYGIPYIFLSIIFHVIFDETLTYWVHRWLHTYPNLYIKYHRYHHRNINVTPYTGFAFHPLDAFAQAVPTFVSCFFFPIHMNIVLIFSIVTTAWAISIHDNVPALPFKLFLYSTHHTIHHEPGQGGMKNFGKFTSVWDRIMGSYEDPDRITYGWDQQQEHLKWFKKLNDYYSTIVPPSKSKKQ